MFGQYGFEVLGLSQFLFIFLLLHESFPPFRINLSPMSLKDGMSQTL